MIEDAPAIAHRVEALFKAHVVGDAVQRATALASGEDGTGPFSSAGAITPPYEPDVLCHLFEHSSSLRPNVDAYVTNIDGFGHRYEPAIELEGDDVDQRVADSMLLERAAAREAEADSEDGAENISADVAEPTAEEIAARRHELQRLSRIEKARLETFFGFCCHEHSFVDLRRRTRQDLEVTGNAYWEVLRDARGRIARFVYVPAHTVRLLPLDAEPVEVEERVRVSPVSYETVTVARRLRRYVQLEGTACVFFRSFGDPRIVSRRTGAVVDSEAALAEQDGPAHELIHFAIHSPRSPYGVPRWVGNLLSVLGSRSSEEVNYLYFESKSVPPLALLVSGGKLSESSVPRIERFIEENIKGKRNFHRILILEAEGAANASETAKAKIEIVPLTQVQQKDGLFQAYDERNIDKVGSSFRVPRLLRGDSRDLNRSTAEAALRFAEDQVFAPERDEFDFMINRRILPDMGIRFWRFRSQTPVTRDPERTSDMVTQLVRVGVLTPEEGRMLASDIFNRELAKIGDDWVKRPITLTLAGVQTQSVDLWPGSGQGDDAVTQAKRLMALRAALENEEQLLAKRRLALAREYSREEPERVVVPSSEFKEWFAADQEQGGAHV
jgi:PBSX family phage portal protein